VPEGEDFEMVAVNAVVEVVADPSECDAPNALAEIDEKPDSRIIRDQLQRCLDIRIECFGCFIAISQPPRARCTDLPRGA